MDTLPAEILSAIVVQVKKLFTPAQPLPEWRGRTTDPEWRLKFGRLRLVNKAFASSIAELLFESVNLSIPIAYKAGPIRFSRLKFVSQRSDIPRHVRGLGIYFSDTGKGIVSRREIIDFVERLHDELPTCLDAFTNIERFMLSYDQEEPIETSTMTKQERQDGNAYNTSFPWIVSHDVMNSMIAMVLLLKMMDNIKHFKIILPCTYDFHSIRRHCNTLERLQGQQHSKVARRFSGLNSLELCVNDKGQGDDEVPRFIWQSDPPDDDEGNHCSDLLQFFGPQREWSEDLLYFANLAPNVTALELDCNPAPGGVSITSLATSKFNGLENLAFSGIETDAQTLIDICTRNRSSLRLLHLAHIQMTSGTWEEVWTEAARTLHGLTVDEFVINCGYSGRGSSWMFATLTSLGLHVQLRGRTSILLLRDGDKTQGRPRHAEAPNGSYQSKERGNKPCPDLAISFLSANLTKAVRRQL